MLNIKPIHFSGMNCFEDAVLTLATHYGREVELVFSGSYGFQYIHNDELNPRPLGQRFGTVNGYSMDLVEKYCGIKYKEDPARTTDEIKAVIRNQLEKNLPTGICIDTFWCPWHDQYQKLHRDHGCLIVGNDLNSGYITIDPPLSLELSVLPYNDFENGCSWAAIFIVDEVKPQNHYHTILKDSVERIRNEDIVNKIRLYRDEFETGFNFDEEFAAFNISPWECDFSRNIKFIGANRLLYKRFIEYIADDYNPISIQNVLNSLYSTADMWKSIDGLLVKSFYTGFNEETRAKILNFLKLIASEEEMLINYLTELLNSRLVDSDSRSILNRTVEKISKGESEPVSLNLEPYFNNIAFGSSVSVDCAADFTFIGHYFLLDNSLAGTVHTIGDMKYSFPKDIGNKCDNISCKGQDISAPAKNYSKITLLGASTSGSFSQLLKVNYVSGFSEVVKISFSDWWCPKPTYSNEEIAFSGTPVEKKDNEAQHIDDPVNLFYIERFFNSDAGEIKSITLPDFPNIHIFAISLS